MKKYRKFVSLVDETGLEDLGASGLTFTVYTLKKGEIYEEQDTTYWVESAKNSPPFIVDGRGCSRDIETALREGLIEEIFD